MILIPGFAPDTEPGSLVAAGSYGWALLKVLLSLVLVCGAAYVLLRLARRFLPGASTRGGCIRVIDRCPLSARQQLWVVEVTGRYYLIGSTDSSLTRLAELDPEDIPPPREEPSLDFRQLLRRRADPDHRPPSKEGEPAARESRQPARRDPPDEEAP